jgi:hypothetical protein
MCNGMLLVESTLWKKMHATKSRLITIIFLNQIQLDVRTESAKVV